MRRLMRGAVAAVFAVLCMLSACSANTEQTKTCTVSISCAVLCGRETELDAQKLALVPVDGWLLAPTEITYEEGESAFDVLLRVCRDEQIHLEFSQTPGYDSAYIEGIGNLYEFDAGARSGWTYSVNGTFPNKGCSSYILQDGDEVCWQYSCDLGADLK